MTHAVVYTRYSPRRNAHESESCETQEAQCREHAEAKGWPVRSAHRDEGKSGKDLDRPGLAAALADLKRGDVLLVYRRCRLARSMLVAELTQRQVKAAGARIAAVSGDISDDDGPEATFARQVMDAVAELERKLIGLRTRAALLAQQKAGKRVGRFAPYGFSVDPRNRTRIVVNEKERQAVIRIKQLAGEGLTPYQVTKAMREELPELARGKEWGTKTVKKILAR